MRFFRFQRRYHELHAGEERKNRTNRRPDSSLATVLRKEQILGSFLWVGHARNSTVDRSQSGGKHLILSIIYILVLALPGAFGAVPANPQSRSDGVKLAEVLTKGSWVYLNNVGPPDHPIA